MKGINFNAAGQYLIWGEQTAVAFEDFYWYYTYSAQRSCSLALSGSNDCDTADLCASATWVPVVTSMDTDATAAGTYTADNIVMDSSYANEAYQFWKIEFVAILVIQGPLMGCVSVSSTILNGCVITAPTNAPTSAPSGPPTPPTLAPTGSPSNSPSTLPTNASSVAPTIAPTYYAVTTAQRAAQGAAIYTAAAVATAASLVAGGPCRQSSIKAAQVSVTTEGTLLNN